MTSIIYEGKKFCDEHFSNSLVDILTNCQEAVLRRIIYSHLSAYSSSFLRPFLLNLLLIADNMIIAARNFIVYCCCDCVSKSLSPSVWQMNITCGLQEGWMCSVTRKTLGRGRKEREMEFAKFVGTCRSCLWF